MPDTIENTKEIPAPVQAARGVIAALEKAGLEEGRLKALSRTLPATAMRLAREGQEVTEQGLAALVVDGEIRLPKAAPAAPPERRLQDVHEALIEKKTGHVFAEVGANLRTNAAENNFEAVKALIEGWPGERGLQQSPEEKVRDLCGYLARNQFTANTFSTCIAHAAQHGRLDMVQYLEGMQGADLHYDGEAALCNAAETGHLHVVKYLHGKGANLSEGDGAAYLSAATGGHVHVMRYLDKNAEYTDKTKSAAMYQSLRTGHLKTIMYLHKRGTPIKWFDRERGRGREYQAFPDEDFFKSDLEGRRLGILKYAHRQGELDLEGHGGRMLDLAVYFGRLDAVRFLHEQGVSLEHHALLYKSIRSGDAAMVAYVCENSSHEGTVGDVSQAALGGAVGIVKYFHGQGVDLVGKEDLPLANALIHGHVETAAYIYEATYDRRASGEIPALEDPAAESLIHDYIFYRDRWLKKTGHLAPEGLEKKSARAMSPAVFKAARSCLRREQQGEREDFVSMAYNAAILFSKESQLAEYLEKWGVEGAKQPLHDSIYMISAPDEGRRNINFKDWRDAVIARGPEMAKYFRFADRLPSPLSSVVVRDGKERRVWSLGKTRDALAQFSYPDGYKNPPLAALFMECALDKKDFDKALELVEQRAQSEKTTAVPDITVPGEEFGMPGALFMRLAVGDPFGLVLGEKTDCCQYIGGDGEKAAEYGFMSPNGGFYALAIPKGKRGMEIIGQSLAWVGTESDLVLDSLESKGGENAPPRVSAEQWEKVLTAFAHRVELEAPEIDSICVGTGGKTPVMEAFTKYAVPAAKPRDPLKGSDAESQLRVWLRRHAPISKRSPPPAR